MDKFWMCFVDGATAPQHKHESKEKAKDEALRLAKTLFKRVTVLEATDSVLLTDVTWTELKPPSDIPF
jgi:hypothetical protein